MRERDADYQLMRRLGVKDCPTCCQPNRHRGDCCQRMPRAREARAVPEAQLMGDFTLHNGDCREVMATFDANSIDAIVTDPPYGLGFMGKEWDNFDPDVVHRKAEMRARQKPIPASGRNGEKPRGRVAAAWEAGRYDLTHRGNRAFQVWCQEWAEHALRVLKPGGHVVVFGSPRTYHRLACGLEDAGFEIRDSLQWLFGSGFPKSLNVEKAMWATAAAVCPIEGPDPAKVWEGWGTALKPAYEPIVLARKPLTSTVAGNVAQWGTGGLNIDACRIGEGAGGDRAGEESATERYGDRGIGFMPTPGPRGGSASGRWPANVLLDDEAAAQLDAMSGATGAFAPVKGTEPTADGFSGHIYGT
ncbi:MAG: DNA methyltransferase, partial [Reyranella sp.]